MEDIPFHFEFSELNYTALLSDKITNKVLFCSIYLQYKGFEKITFDDRDISQKLQDHECL